MISIGKIKNKLFNNPDAIVTILEKLDMTNINHNELKQEVRCSRDVGRNPSSVCIKTDTLAYKCFSTAESGDILTFVMNKTGKTLYQTLVWIAKELNFTDVHGEIEEVPKPFGGFYKRIYKPSDEPELQMITYDESILDDFKQGYSYTFLQDGISLDSQQQFGIGYDWCEDRITIPQRDIYGQLVGVMGRANAKDCPHEQRWLPVIPCKRGMTLYGFHTNYEAIMRENICFIGESEKFVMQLHSMGVQNSLATCGFDITRYQARRIKEDLGTTKALILCQDEGLDEEVVRAQCEKIARKTGVYRNKVGYIWDDKGIVLPKGSKASPTDFGKQGFAKLLKNNIKWL